MKKPRVAYDRVNLSGFFSGKTAGDLSLVAPGFYQENGIQIYIGDKAVAINREHKIVSSANGLEVPYDKIVLATGSYPFVPSIKGKDATGTFVYRTIDDLEAMLDYAKNCQTGVVIGGGLLGLECANALQNMGLKTHVVEFASRLMPVQVDEIGGAILRSKIEELGVSVHTSKSTTEIVSEDGKVTKMLFADGSELATDMIVFSAGIRPRDEIARSSGIEVGERGGIVINDSCQTSDPDIYAIGECALYQNRIYGLVAPGYTMASVAADILSRAADCRQDAPSTTSTFTGADMSTKLKLLGVDVASFGDPFPKSGDAKEIVVADTFQGIYKKLVLNQDGSRILGGILVGDASAYGTLLQFMQNEIALPPHPEDLLMPPREGGAVAGFGVDSLPDSAQICSCNNVTKGQICEAIRDRNLTDVASVKKCTQAGDGLRWLRAFGDGYLQGGDEKSWVRRQKSSLRTF